MSDPNPSYYERLLAPLLGFTRDDLVYIRREVLEKEQGAWRYEGRDIVITQLGLDLILTRLRESQNDAPLAIDFSAAQVPTGKKEGPPALLMDRPAPEKKAGVQLTVVRCYPNPRMLQATTPAGKKVDVRVKTNKNFVPKMTLEAREVCPGKYEMEGRCPRTRGRY